MDLVKTLTWAEMLAFTALGVWMSAAVWQSARGRGRLYDSNRFLTAWFSFLLAYRDLRVLFLNDVPEAKVVMLVVGLVLCAFAGVAARAYGRGERL